MGIMQHHAIVVSDWDETRIEGIAARARASGAYVLGPSEPQTNGVRTLCVVPDGSKEGWETSAEGDRRRDALATYLRSIGAEWAEVTYGEVDLSLVRGSSPDDPE